MAPKKKFAWKINEYFTFFFYSLFYLQIALKYLKLCPTIVHKLCHAKNE